MAIRQVSFAAPQQQSPLVQALAPRSPLSMISAQALQEGTSTAPVQSIGEGLARLGQAGLGGWFAGAEKRRADEASGRLADAILGSMTPEQRAGPQGQLLATALRDPNAGPALSAAYLQNSMTPRETWTPDPTGMFQVSSMTGERRPLESPERARAMAAAGRDPIITTPNGPYSRDALLANATPQPGATPGVPQAAGGLVPPPSDLPPVLQELWRGESGNNLNAVSVQGARGPLQFTQDTWNTTLQRHPELVQAGITPNHIMDAQANALVGRAHAQDILTDGRDLLGRQVGNSTITEDALIRGAWLGGVGGMRRWVSSNGQEDPADALGTRVSQYAMGTAPNLRSNGRGIQRSPLPEPGNPAAAEAQAPRPIEQLLPDGSGRVPGLSVPAGAREPLMARTQPGALMPGPTQQQIATAREIRNSHLSQPEVRNTQRVVAVYNSMQDAASRNTAASDLNMVYGLMTILDPSSVVREGEVTMVRNTQGIPSWLVGMYDRLSSGNASLQPEDRQRIMVEARSRAEGQLGIYNHLRDNEESFLGNLDYNPNAVLGQRFSLPVARPTLPQSTPTPAQPAAPTAAPAGAAPAAAPTAPPQSGSAAPAAPRQSQMPNVGDIAEHPITRRRIRWDGRNWVPVDGQ